MKKNTIKINYILWLSFMVLTWFSAVSWAKIYLDPTYSGFVKNCPSTVNIMIDTEWKNIIASEINIYFDKSLMQVVSFEYGNAFKWWGLTQTRDGSARMLGFDVNPINWIYTFGKLIIKSIWNTTAWWLNFQDPSWKTQSSLAEFKSWKELLKSVKWWYYTFFDGTCSFSWNVWVWIENNFQVISKKYSDQINALRKQYMEKLRKEKMINGIIIISWLLLIIIVLLYFWYRRFKSYNSKKLWK